MELKQKQQQLQQQQHYGQKQQQQRYGGGVESNNTNTVGRGVVDVPDERKKNNIPLSFPPGYRFHPHDEELIIHYLQKKVSNLDLPYNNINDVNLYQYNPEDLIEKYQLCGEKFWYFFTPRDRKYRNGTRPNRAAGDGYWKATGADRPIYNNKKIVGYRKALVFYKGKPTKSSSSKTNWIMHEYRVPEATENLPRIDGSMRLDDWVLCRIHWKPERTERPTKIRRKEDGQTAIIDPTVGCDESDNYLNDIDSVALNCNFNSTEDNITPNSLFGEYNDYALDASFLNDSAYPFEYMNSALDAYNHLYNIDQGAYNWRNAIPRSREQPFTAKPENYDVPSQINLFNRTMMESNHLSNNESVGWVCDELQNPNTVLRRT
ncbi:NAC transcription factor 25-like [Magnolia sinica]|uniref:NAC transcription factor 25-like n=1 Tax=Magnolia sinica TaxID=86752 RepID=UPI00265B48ED|nr:NAC transcription factor 25-like [Magnolia sinica]